MTHDPLTFGNLFGSMRGAEFAPSDYEQGQADMLAKCIAAVEALICVEDCETCEDLREAVTAIKSLGEQQ